MRIALSLYFVLTTLMSHAQLAAIGNTKKLCFPDTLGIEVLDSLPKNLSKYQAICIFSGSTSIIGKKEIDSLTAYLERGGGLYLGAENVPMQAESNEITRRLYNKERYGSYNEELSITPTNSGNLKLDDLDSFPAGRTTVAFPLDYRLKVEAWIKDDPLILSGTFGAGRVIIDGGYSRFYCGADHTKSSILWNRFMAYLISED